MKTTAETISMADLAPLVTSFIRFWERSHTKPMQGRMLVNGKMIQLSTLPNPPVYPEPPKAIDLVDWLVAMGHTHDEACHLLNELIAQGRVWAHPDGRPAFIDEPLYCWIQEVA